MRDIDTALWRNEAEEEGEEGARALPPLAAYRPPGPRGAVPLAPRTPPAADARARECRARAGPVCTSRRQRFTIPFSAQCCSILTATELKAADARARGAGGVLAYIQKLFPARTRLSP